MDEPAQAQKGDETPLSTPQELVQPLTAPPPTGSVTEGLTSLSSVSSELRKSDPEKQACSSEQKCPSEYHAKFSEELHNYLREYIRNADQKATFFFAGATALLAFLHSQRGTSRWLKDVRTWTAVDGLAFLAMISLALSACALLSVVFPRLKGSRRGLIFFGAIAEYESSREYADEVLRRSMEEIVTSKLQHTYDLAKVCVAKYRMLRIGFWIGSIGVVATLLFLVFAQTIP